jgi:hypothetical protein
MAVGSAAARWLSPVRTIFIASAVLAGAGMVLT